MHKNKTVFLAGMLFGDEGKGTITDYLTRILGADLVVRYNGGAQCAHNVVAPDGRHHTFCQFGSGTFVPGVKTLLSRHVIVNPIGLVHEGDDLASKGVPDVFSRIAVDARALVITPYHVVANRVRSLSLGGGCHGTCGQGIGETVADSLAAEVPVIRVGDLARDDLPDLLRAVRRAKLAQVGHLISGFGDKLTKRERQTLEDDRHLEAYLSWISYFVESVKVLGEEAFNEAVRASRVAVFEGAQGALLHEDGGFFPHVTWTDTSFANAEAIVSEAGREGAVRRVGILRAYATRHGAGPFVSESPSFTRDMQDAHNRSDHPWQRTFRVGPFDLVAARYALDLVGGVDCLAFTCLDRLPATGNGWEVCEAYRFAGDVEDGFVDGAPVAKRLLVSRPFDLDRQSRLARTLREAEPSFFRSSAKTPEDFVGELAVRLGCPIGILSMGPGAEQKRLTSFGESLFGSNE